MKNLFIICGLLVIIATSSHAYPTATGGTITTNAGYRIHTFLSDGNFTVSGGTLNCEVLVVAGGGGGGGYIQDPGGGGGGGGGGILYVASSNVVAGNYSITIGTGGGSHANGNNSVFSSLTALGGGAGGEPLSAGGANGGCGGGGAPSGTYNGGAGSQGGNGGGGYWGGTSDKSAGGGGGGATDNGETAWLFGSYGDGGNGGNGTAYSISGSSVTYAGGGGGGAYSGYWGDGGLGGGGRGGRVLNPAVSGTASLGGGGGGAGGTGNGGSGGSGIVIVRYLIMPQNATTPNPANGAVNQATNLTLSWTAGADTTSFNVNFGISNNMVAKGNQTATSYTPTNVTWNTNYQWRIDSVNAQGTTQGSVWSFGTITILKAKNPVPSDNYTGVSLSGTNLQWQGGGGETNFTVYFGLSGTMSNVYSGAGTNYNTGTLEKGKTYTWRVDSQNASASVTGDTWAFYSEWFVIAHKIMGVVDNVSVFGRKGNRIWGK